MTYFKFINGDGYFYTTFAYNKLMTAIIYDNELILW